ncbi:MAG: hypothetical protein H6598_02315 [Flavobacteriales bacterium]|nr:hypothetical protein [Flavobacteriales bacterium]
MIKTILLIGTLATSIQTISAQTNRINHYSHSGKTGTLNIFKANDNLGLGCGSALKNEYVPPAMDTNAVLWGDSLKIDSTKTCTPPNNSTGMKAIEKKIDTSSVYNRGPK